MSVKSKTQHGKTTREQIKRVINKDEGTDSPSVETSESTSDEVNSAEVGSRDAYNISTGDRSIQRGANDRGDHDKGSK
jgi:hypothetical protein